MASTALAPAFDQRHPDCLNRFPTMQLQALSAMPDPTGRPRVRQGSQRIRSLLASQVRMEGGEDPMRSRDGLAGSGRRNREIEGESARTAAAGQAGSRGRPVQAYRRSLVRLPGSKAIRRAT